MCKKANGLIHTMNTANTMQQPAILKRQLLTLLPRYLLTHLPANNKTSVRTATQNLAQTRKGKKTAGKDFEIFRESA